MHQYTIVLPVKAFHGRLNCLIDDPGQAFGMKLILRPIYSSLFATSSFATASNNGGEPLFVQTTIFARNGAHAIHPPGTITIVLVFGFVCEMAHSSCVILFLAS